MNKKTKFCECCNVEITRQNFTTHKSTKKHIRNKEKYKPINLLDCIKDEKHDLNYIKIQLEDMRKNIEIILKNID
jgi:hypothetical protein